MAWNNNNNGNNRNYNNNSNYGNGGNNFPMTQQQMFAMMQNMMKQGGTNNQKLKTSYAVYSKIKQGQHAGLFNITGVKIMKGGVALIANAHPRTGQNGKLRYNVTNPNDTVERIKYKVKVHSSDRPHVVEEFFATYNPETQVLNVPDLSMCISSNGDGFLKKWSKDANGFVAGKKVTGYFGRNYKKS